MVRQLEEGRQSANPAAFHDRMASSDPDEALRDAGRGGGAGAFLCSADAAYITGAIYPVDGGSMA